MGAIRALGIVLRIPGPIRSLLPRRPACSDRSHRHIRRPAPPDFRVHVASTRDRRPRFPLDATQIPALRASQPHILVHAFRDALEEIKELHRIFLVEKIEVRWFADVTRF